MQSVTQCRHRQIVGRLIHCRLVQVGVPAAKDPCPACQLEWVDGKEPDADNVPVTARLLGKLGPTESRNSIFESRSIVIYSPMSMPAARRDPSTCDHAGDLLTRGRHCAAREYDCELHGRVNCVRCGSCPDFLPVESLAAPPQPHHPANPRQPNPPHEPIQ